MIDASGRHSVLGNHFKLKETYPHLQKISIFAHYDGVELEEGRDATLTRQVRATDRWFWYIPLPNDRSSIGVVSTPRSTSRRRNRPSSFSRNRSPNNRFSPAA